LTEKEALLKQLDDQLESALIFLNQIEEAETLPQDVLHEFKYDLLTLQNKHIPAEMCSEGKLMERILQVEALLDKVKWEIRKSPGAL
jgi:hypothetical protein